MNLADKISDLTITRQLLLNRVAGGISNEIDQLLIDLSDDVEKKIGARNLTDYQKDRMARLIRELGEFVSETYTEAESLVRDRLSALGQAEAAWAQASINAAAGFDLLRVLPTAAAIETVARVDLMQGAPLSEWFKRQRSDTQFRITQAIRLGVSQGETNGQIVARLRGLEQTDTRDNVIATSKRNLEAIVRTSVQQVATDARIAVFDDNEDVFKYWQHRSTLDGRTSVTCVARSNLLWDYKTKQPVNHSLPYLQPPVHWNCLPGDSLITACGAITGASKRWVNANLVVIRVAAGNELACTPNHPILTSRGWVPAQFVNYSDKVVCGAVAEREGLTEWDNKNVIPTIHDIAESFFSSSVMLTMPMPMTAKDFHGDGVDGEIAVVCSNRGLLPHWKTGVKESIKQGSFVKGSSANTSKFKSLRHFGFFIKTPLSAFIRKIRSSRQLFSSFKISIFHAGKLLLASVSRLNAIPLQNSHASGNRNAVSFKNTPNTDATIEQVNDLLFGHSALFKAECNMGILSRQDSDAGFNSPSFSDSVRDAALVSDILDGKYGTVTLSDVVAIGRRDFSDHVYNLETENGFYAANGIITHNCRSVMLAIPKSFRELGIDEDEIPPSTRSSMDGQVAEDLSFGEFLKKKGTAFQDKMLGKGRADLWREGKITLPQLLDQRGNPLSVRELREKYAS